MFRVAGYHAEIGGKLPPISAGSRGLFLVAKNLWLGMTACDVVIASNGGHLGFATLIEKATCQKWVAMVNEH